MRTRWRREPWEEVRLGGGERGEVMAVMGVLWSCCSPCRDGTQASAFGGGEGR